MSDILQSNLSENDFSFYAKKQYERLSEKEKDNIKRKHFERIKKGKATWNQWAKSFMKAEVDNPIIDLSNLKINASFYGFIFPCSTSFASCEFIENSIFVDTQFHGFTNFERAKFVSSAEFYRAQFYGEVSFTQAHFERNAEFYDAKFEVNVVFVSVIFSQVANFEKAKFERAAFDKSRFDSYSEFMYIECEHYVTFDDVEFKNHSRFDFAKFNSATSFSKVVFHEFVDFICVQFYGDVYVHDTQFMNYVRFENTSFRNNASFDNTKFWDSAVFNGSEFHKGALFTSSLFKSDTSFTQTRFEGQTSFEMAVLRKVPDFNFSTFIQSPHISSIRIDESNDFSEIGSVERFRKIKQMAIQSNDRQNELKFYGLETHAKAYHPETPISEKIIIKFYYWFSNFGSSLNRPLISLVVFLTMMVALNLVFITPESDSCEKNSVEFINKVAAYTLSTALPIFKLKNEQLLSIDQCLFSSETFTIKYNLWELFHFIPASMFLFLFGLALRNRFRIK